MTAPVRRRLVISGRVQGVFFRDRCQAEAHAHHVAGWVTNRSDGSVEAVLEGTPRPSPRSRRGAGTVPAGPR